MSNIRTSWLYIILGLEVVVIGILVAVALLRPEPAVAPAPAKTDATSPAVTYKTPKIDTELVLSGLIAPTAIESLGVATDKRLFVSEQGGKIQMIDEDGKLAQAPLLDISQKVLNQGEMGLLGFAFHPSYPDKPYLYAYYINKDKAAILSRFEVERGTVRAKPATEKVLINLPQVYTNHKAGQVAFGPDGYLYFGMGDGGGAGDPDDAGQNKNMWFGKILRLDVNKGDTYAVPATNPFKDDSNAKPEIWAWGLRNPWRFSFDRKTGDLYIADVGQNKHEEINFQKAASKGGENYGWRCYEASTAFNTDGCGDAGQYTKPAFEYSHDEGRCSVTGGYVYRGAAEPALTGKYFYGDFCSGDIWYAEQQKGNWSITRALDTKFMISTFGQDGAGELYTADMETGNLYRLTDSAN